MGSTRNILGTLVNEYNAGMSTSAIARRHKVSQSAVLRALRKQGNIRPPVSAVLTAGVPRFDTAQAACRRSRPAIFFEGRGNTLIAKSICALCPVRAECAAYAIPIADLWGIWGGLTMSERKTIRKRWEL